VIGAVSHGSKESPRPGNQHSNWLGAGGLVRLVWEWLVCGEVGRVRLVGVGCLELRGWSEASSDDPDGEAWREVMDGLTFCDNADCEWGFFEHVDRLSALLTGHFKGFKGR
jgi:hypothetical protein